MSTTLYLIRHGESEGNVGLAIKDPSLTENGIKQVQELKSKLKKIDFQMVYCSHKRRTIQSGLILTDSSREIIINPDLVEVKGPKISKTNPDNTSENEVKVDFWNLSEEEKWSFKTNQPGDESAQEAYARITSVLDNICSKYPEGNVQIISHGFLLRIFLIGLKYSTFKQIGKRGSLENCGYIVTQKKENTYIIRNVVGLNQDK